MIVTDYDRTQARCCTRFPGRQTLLIQTIVAG